jgi:hypothetical protein
MWSPVDPMVGPDRRDRAERKDVSNDARPADAVAD